MITPIPDLIASHPTGLEGFAIFQNLGSGSVYGTTTVSSADNNSVDSLSLNATSLSGLNNNAGGLFAIGGRLVPDSDFGVDRVIFLNSGAPQDTRQLVLDATAVPEPATTLLLGTSLAGIAAEVTRRRRGRRA